MEQRIPSSGPGIGTPGLDAAAQAGDGGAEDLGSQEVTSGVGVLDKAALVLSAVEAGPASLGDLVARTGLSRATAHRLAVALQAHRLVGRDGDGRFVAGPRLAAGSAAATLWPLPWQVLQAAPTVLAELRDATGESTQLYVRRGAGRVCVAVSERGSGLRDTVPVGAILPMTAGSGAQVLLAFATGGESGGEAAEVPGHGLRAGDAGGRGPRAASRLTRCSTSGCWPRCAPAAGRRAPASGRRDSRRCRRRSATPPVR